MITNPEKEQLRQLLSMPQWRTAQLLAEQICEKIQDGSVVRDTEWETLRAVLIKEGQVEGIRKFIQELYASAQ